MTGRRHRKAVNRRCCFTATPQRMAAGVGLALLLGCTTSRSRLTVDGAAAPTLPASAASADDLTPAAMSSESPVGVQLAAAQQPAEPTSAGPAPGAANALGLAQPADVLPAAPAAAEPLASAVAAPAILPIDFATALSIAAGDNPQVAYARGRIGEAFAQHQAANALWLPSIRAGMNYNKHEGVIQDVAGSMIETSRGSVYSGLGAFAVGAGSPAVPGVYMNFHGKDFIYQPRITEQVLAASRQASRAATNDVLLDTALAYNSLLEARQIEAVSRETLAHADRLAVVTGDFARTGQGLPADSDRASTELATRRIDERRAVEDVQLATIRLTRLMSSDQSIALVPVETSLVPIDVAPAHCQLAELTAMALSNRPELAESRLLAGAAVERLRREQNAPLIPSVLLGMSYGGNGGGLGSDIENYGDRLDLDAVAYWEVRNLGYGEQAARDEARARIEQARWRQVQALDQVAAEVAEAYASVNARRDQIDLARAGVESAQQSYERNAQRIQEAAGLPIEALQSIQALDAARRQYIRAIADYNRAQFQLQRALGWPIQ